MLFNSLAFLVFFPIVTIGYFALGNRSRWAWLLAASCYFYSFFVPVYLLILIFTIFVDYWAGILIEGASGRARKGYLVLSLAANIGVLAVFKYFNFFSENVNEALALLGLAWHAPMLSILLPIGLSFHTFQAMSYTIEVYRGNQKAERHLGIYALYVMFYPQLVAGPIERPQNLLPQFHANHPFSDEDLRAGLRLMLLGVVKKVVVADRVALLVDRVYDNPSAHSAPALALATVCFAVQIYADFSGYSDIALGAARVMGIRMMQNFRQPYLSTSISEFWKRWHISLSTWFRDYLYFPLGGNRRGWTRWQLNLFVTFLLSGLWHGAKWTYVIWGAINGFYLVFANLTSDARMRLRARAGFERIPRAAAFLSVLVTFGLTCLAWVFFRASTVADAAHVLTTIVVGAADLLRPGVIWTSLKSTGLAAQDLLRVGLAAAGMLAFDWACVRFDAASILMRQPRWVRWGLYYAAIIVVLRYGVFGEQQFIYFQF